MITQLQNGHLVTDNTLASAFYINIYPIIVRQVT